MGLISNRVKRRSLRPGDHIYTWRACHIYAHHGIYAGDNKVIHFVTTQGREPGTGTRLDRMIASSISSCSHVPRPAARRGGRHGVVRDSCLDCFLKGGKLYRYKYSVNVAFFVAKMRGGTCTRAVSDGDDVVVRRANYLLHNGFGSYNLFRNNCENFAVYCKTGLLVLDQCMMGQSGQMVGAVAVPLAAGVAILHGLPAVLALSSPEFALAASIGMTAELLSFPMIIIYATPALALGLYCLLRLNADIGKRKDVVKVSVEEFASMGVVAMNPGLRCEYWKIIIIT